MTVPHAQHGPRSAAMIAIVIGMAAVLLPGTPWASAGARAADPPAWPGAIDLYHDGVFTTQPDWVTCVPTAAQIMRNIVLDRSDHSGSEIQQWYRWGRSQTAYAYKVAGLDPQAWGRILTKYGAGPYDDRSYDTPAEAVEAAVQALRLTNKPIGILANHGGHAWVMTGFTATDDPATNPDAQVTSIRITGPLYPKQQKNGYDMAPDTDVPIDQFASYFLDYTDTVPVPWIGKYVIVAPVVLDHPLDSYAPVTRLSGADRYATATAISATFDPGVPVAFVATGRTFPDALGAGAAAARRGGPVLLVDGQASTLPASVAAELERLTPGRIVVVGSTGAVGAAIATQLATFGPVTRVAGSDRYGTSAAISASTFKPGVGVAYVATGRTFPDALAGGALAGSDGSPILLVDGQGSGLPPAVVAELKRLKPAKIVVLGGTPAVSGRIATALGAIAPVSRLSGPDRYATAAAISAAFKPGVPAVYVATGGDFPDALAGVAAAARDKAPLLLVGYASIPGPIAAELGRLKPGEIVVLGGIPAVSDTVAGFGP